MAGEPRRARPTGLAARVAGLDDAHVRLAAGAVALLGAGSMALVRLARNVPADVPALAGGGLYGLASAFAVLGPAAAAIVTGVAAADDREWVALVFAGSFALLTLASGAATVPAAVVVGAAGALVLAARATLRSWAGAVAGALVAALALSLGAGMGVLPVTARQAGTAATLVALAATPLVVRPSWRTLLVGTAAAVGVAAAALLAPFATSASVLVVGAAVDPPLALLAAGVGGAAATVATGATTGRTAAVLGGGLLLAAGVPATVPRALAVVLGAGLILDAADRAPQGGDAGAV